MAKLAIMVVVEDDGTVRVQALDPERVDRMPQADQRRGGEDDDRLLSSTEVAEYLGVPVRSLYMWRRSADGPRASKVGRHLRYRYADVQSWLDGRSSDTAAELRRRRRPAGDHH